MSRGQREGQVNEWEDDLEEKMKVLERDQVDDLEKSEKEELNSEAVQKLLQGSQIVAEE